ncbi:MAG: DoxX family protein [Planctomycetia bacterium]|nr:DoxX family protein [Planctomycetia bacterium]
MMTFGIVTTLTNAQSVIDNMVNKFGYPQELAVAIGITQLCCLVLYLIPRTAVLGAVLLTGYLGGAVATHVRVHDNFAAAAIVGVLVWLSLYLRDPRVRALLPLRRPLTPGEPDARS